MRDLLFDKETRQRFLTAKDLAQKFGVCIETVYNWVKAGLPCYRGGAKGQGKMYFDPAAVEAWFREAGNRRQHHQGRPKKKKKV